jgi:hypothetical protein
MNVQYPSQGAHPFAPQHPASVLPPVVASTQRANSRKSRRRTIFGALVIGAAVASMVGCSNLTGQSGRPGKANSADSKESSSLVGACTRNSGTIANPDMVKVDCQSAEAEYKVIQEYDGTLDTARCDLDKYSAYTEIDPAGGKYLYCLQSLKGE